MLNFPKIKSITQDDSVLVTELENFMARTKKSNINFELDEEKQLIRKKQG